MRWYLKLIGLAITFLPVSLAPAFGQNCSNGYFDQNLEEESPTQRVGSARISRHLALDINLRWAKPADFTEILPFLGNTHQLAEHEGIDFINSNQSVDQVSVRSAANGKVVYIRNGCPQSYPFERNTEKRGCGGDWGNHIVLFHSNGLFTRYAHLRPESIQVQVGQKVRLGDEIAKMGNSGRSDTRHLHFELGITHEFKPCEPAQSFKYVYDPAIYLEWNETYFSHRN
jgi:murein DD-endopeptidase MepM/ murein hydrolase activator NlpD